MMCRPVRWQWLAECCYYSRTAVQQRTSVRGLSYESESERSLCTVVLPWVVAPCRLGSSVPLAGPPTGQGQMKSPMKPVNRSLATIDFKASQLFKPLVIKFNQSVRFSTSGEETARPSHEKKKVFKRKSKIAGLLAANPVTRGRKLKQQDGLSHRQLSQGEIEDDENVDIHSPEGALQKSLPTDEEINQYTTNNNFDTEAEISHGEGLNEFDKLYFADAAKYKPPSHNLSTFGTKCVETDTSGVSETRNEFDRQYFGMLQDTAPITSTTNPSSKIKNAKDSKSKKGVSAFMDTNAPENHFEKLAYDADIEKEMVVFNKKLGQLVEDVGQNKNVNIMESLFEFKPHETATPFLRLDTDVEDHKELTYEMDSKLGDEASAGPLRVEFEAEPDIEEEKPELRIGNHNLSDLEPEIIKAMRSVLNAKRQVGTKSRQNINKKVVGSPDLSLPATNVCCSGCGARFQPYDRKLPGFLPGEKYRELLDSDQLKRAGCQRCWYLTHRQTALEVSISGEDYQDIILSIKKKKKALIVVLVDLLDFPCSLIPNLKDMVGETKPIIIVGNKADVIPRDSADCQNRMTKQLLRACIDAGVCTKDNVKHVGIISAKSGYGIEDLITALQEKWGTQGDVYLLGTANVGKSTLFNRLLESDYCKAKASYLIGKATISRWPGTTLNLLRFPVVRLSPEKKTLRESRLAEERKRAKEEAATRREPSKRNPESPTLDEEAYVRGSVGRSYHFVLKTEEKELDRKINPFALSLGPDVSASVVSPTKAERRGMEERRIPFNPQEFDLGRWFHDTPGLIHDQQILTKLTSDELKVILPKKAILPGTLVLKPGNTIFLGGMGRVDYLEGKNSALFTVFASTALPVKVTTTDEAGDYYENMINKDSMKVPIGGRERMGVFPPLQPVDMTIAGQGWKCSAADVLFSSAGWVAVTGPNDMEIRLRAYTPGGCGCILRSPALLPYAVNLRGDRMQKNRPFFRVDKQKLLQYL